MFYLSQRQVLSYSLTADPFQNTLTNQKLVLLLLSFLGFIWSLHYLCFCRQEHQINLSQEAPTWNNVRKDATPPFQVFYCAMIHSFSPASPDCWCAEPVGNGSWHRDIYALACEGKVYLLEHFSHSYGITLPSWIEKYSSLHSTPMNRRIVNTKIVVHCLKILPSSKCSHYRKKSWNNLYTSTWFKHLKSQLGPPRQWRKSVCLCYILI